MRQAIISARGAVNMLFPTNFDLFTRSLHISSPLSRMFLTRTLAPTKSLLLPSKNTRNSISFASMNTALLGNNIVFRSRKNVSASVSLCCKSSGMISSQSMSALLVASLYIALILLVNGIPRPRGSYRAPITRLAKDLFVSG